MKNLIFLALFFVCCTNSIPENPFSKTELETFMKSKINPNIIEVKKYDLINDSFFLSIDSFKAAYSRLINIHTEVQEIARTGLNKYSKTFTNIPLLCSDIINDSNTSIYHLYTNRYMMYYNLIYSINDEFPQDSDQFANRKLIILEVEVGKQDSVLRSVFKSIRMHLVIDSGYFEIPRYFVSLKIKEPEQGKIKDTFDIIEFNNGTFRQIHARR